MTYVTAKIYAAANTSAGLQMAADNRDLLTVLRAELAFVENGGYSHAARAAWRPQFLFQDSPTCLNFDPTQQTRPCKECVLMELVPPQARKLKIPCRYIPLNNQEETADFFYRSGTQDELEAAAKQWLKDTIARLERERTLEWIASKDAQGAKQFVAGRGS